MKLLLASQSRTRRVMLEHAGVPFATVAAEMDEEAAKAELLGRTGAAAIAERLAQLKALAVDSGPDELVLGADQVLEREDGTILGKAGSREEAADQLRSLAGREHQLHSAAVLVRERQIQWRGSESVRLFMRPLSDSFLIDYLDREWDRVRWSVGVYRVEGMGAQLFDRIEGSHFAVLGLPLLPLLAELRRVGVVAS